MNACNIKNIMYPYGEDVINSIPACAVTNYKYSITCIHVYYMHTCIYMELT